MAIGASMATLEHVLGDACQQQPSEIKEIKKNKQTEKSDLMISQVLVVAVRK
jgi:hypothetical protein